MSLELQKAISGYETYINQHGIDIDVVRAYHNSVFYAYEKDNDLQEALKNCRKGKRSLKPVLHKTVRRRHMGTGKVLLCQQDRA